MRTAGLLALAILFPFTALAAVRINEIAWMGSSVSANAEWIELINTDAAPVSLSGWRLTSSTGSPDIQLSGTIAANGFYLLERTSDDAVPGIPADQIYTGTLANGGAVLTLENAAGTVVDTADGSGSWAQVGGDNTTKETAQRTQSSWITASATPRAENGAQESSATDAQNTATASTTNNSTSVSHAYVPPPTGALTVTLHEESAMSYRNVPLTFTATAYTKNSSVDGNASFVWSFGDGSSAAGSQVEKTYHYSGAYIVNVRAIDGDAQGSADSVVTVSEAKLQVAAISGDGITLRNDTDARVDLSRYELVSGMSTFRIPSGTMLLPSSETLFPYSITNLPVSFTVRLLYPDGLLAAAYVAPDASPATTTEVSVSSVAQPAAFATGSYIVRNKKSAPDSKNVTAPATAYAPNAASATTTETKLAAVVAAFSTTTPSAAASSASRGGILSSPWTFGFLGVVILAGAAVMIL